MDGISGVSSVFAVVSLAIQLAESAKKLYDFWKSVDEAPASIQRIVADLKLVSTVLAEIAQHEQKYGQDGSVVDILTSCMDQIRTMDTMTAQLQHGLQSKTLHKRKWSAIKAVFKEDKIAKFQSRLMDAKTTLILVRQTLSDKSIHAYFDHHGQMFVAMTQGMEALREQNTQTAQILGTLQTPESSSPGESLKETTARAASHVANPYLRSGFEKAMEIAIKEAQREFERGQDIHGPSHGHFPSMAPRSRCRPNPNQWRLLRSGASRTSWCFFGDITVQSNTFEKTSDKGDGLSRKAEETENRLRVIFRPATWLMRLGLAYELRLALSKSSHGWKGSFQVYQPVPNDSLIFKFCRTGNIDAVQLLFSRKEASVWDVNSYGWSPLHVAAHTHQMEVVKFLLNQGADSDAVPYSQFPLLCLLFSGIGNIPESVPSEPVKFYGTFFDSISLFVHQFEWDRLDLANFDKLCGLEECSCESTVDKDLPISVELCDYLLKKLAQTLGFHLSTSEFAQDVFWSICFFFEAQIPLSTITWIINAYGSIVDGGILPSGYPPILAFIACNRWDIVEAFANSGADLHLAGQDNDYSPVEETATSLALYNSGNFFAWRKLIRDLGMDIEKFIEDELQNSRLQRDGWNAQSLKALFALEVSPVDRHEDCEDCRCGNRDFAHADGSDAEDEGHVDKDGENEDDEIDRDDDSEDDDDGRCGHITEVMVELDWQKLLERIKHGEDLAGYIDKYLEGSDTQSRGSYDGNRDIEEISNAEGSEGGEERQQIDVADEEAVADEGGIEDDDDNWEDVSEEDLEDDYGDSPEWFCIYCWHGPITSDTSSTPTLEVESDEEDSPMLLKIGI